MCLVVVSVVLFSQVVTGATILDGSYQLHPKPDGKTPFAVRGWAVASCDPPQTAPTEVVLTIDDEEVLRGRPSSAWPGVEERYPDVPGAAFAGFSGEVNPAKLQPGDHHLEVIVEACGLKKSLGSRSFRVAHQTSSWVAVLVLTAMLAVVALFGFALAGLKSARGSIRHLPAAVAATSFVVLAILVGARHVGEAVIEIGGGIFAPLANWDGRYYLGLAIDGYGTQVNAPFAFFPLFPVVLRLLSWLPIPLELSAALLNGCLFVIAVVLLRRLYPEKDHAIVIFAALPFAFFHLVVYTEALALVLALAFVVAVRDRRLWAVLVFGVLAGLCRVPGPALACFSIGPLCRRDWRTASVAATSPFLGTMLWMLYLGVKVGDPLAFVHVQSEFGRTSFFEFGGFLDLLKSLPTRGGMVWWEFGSLVVVLVGSAVLIRLRRYDEALYSAAMVLLPILSMRLTSVNRYALAAFPVFVVLGGRIAGVLPRGVFWAIVAAEVAGLFYFAARFGLQHWVG